MTDKVTEMSRSGTLTVWPACINKWDETSELLWLDVQIRKACKVWNRLSEESKGNYCSTKTALRKYFKPDSHRDLYVAEFHIPKKKRDESWDDLAGNLQTLAELVLLDLEEYGKDRLSLERLLNLLDKPNVALAVCQKHPSNCTSTLEIKAILLLGSP